MQKVDLALASTSQTWLVTICVTGRAWLLKSLTNTRPFRSAKAPERLTWTQICLLQGLSINHLHPDNAVRRRCLELWVMDLQPKCMSQASRTFVKFRVRLIWILPQQGRSSDFRTQPTVIQDSGRCSSAEAVSAECWVRGCDELPAEPEA